MIPLPKFDVGARQGTIKTGSTIITFFIFEQKAAEFAKEEKKQAIFFSYFFFASFALFCSQIFISE